VIGDVLWRPPADVLESTEVGRFASARGLRTYEELWRWSVDDLEAF
jgi:acetoacetyl-CoA synthetase